MPIWMAVFFYPVGNQVYFTQDFAITISSEDKSFGIDAVGLEFFSDSPSLQ
jgi:hypothetical protein